MQPGTVLGMHACVQAFGGTPGGVIAPPALKPQSTTVLNCSARSASHAFVSCVHEPSAPMSHIYQTGRARHSVQVNFGQELVLVGSTDSLGGWELARAPHMTWNEGDLWTATIELPAGTHVEYKFALWDPHR